MDAKPHKIPNYYVIFNEPHETEYYHIFEYITERQKGGNKIQKRLCQTVSYFSYYCRLFQKIRLYSKATQNYKPIFVAMFPFLSTFPKRARIRIIVDTY